MGTLNRDKITCFAMNINSDKTEQGRQGFVRLKVFVS